ncbi:MAG: hypothetical protein ACHQPI_03470 [Thermoanaerobaculia bacterium]
MHLMGTARPSVGVSYRMIRSICLVALLAPGAVCAESARPSPGAAQKFSLREPMDQSGCTICLTGAASVTWSGGTGSFHVDHVVNNESATTGSLQLGVILAPGPPSFGPTLNYYQFSDFVPLSPLAVGTQQSNVNSGSIVFDGSRAPAGTYYELLFLTEYVGGGWVYVDWIVFPTRVSCNGTACQTTTIPSCLEDAMTMCLIGGRYRVTSHWQNQYAGGAVSNLSRATLTDATGAFWISDASTFEYLIRIQTGTGNGHAWIAIPSFTDVEFFILVEDLFNGQSNTYHSPPGNRTLTYDPSFFVYP